MRTGAGIFIVLDIREEGGFNWGKSEGLYHGTRRLNRSRPDCLMRPATGLSCSQPWSHPRREEKPCGLCLTKELSYTAILAAFGVLVEMHIINVRRV